MIISTEPIAPTNNATATVPFSNTTVTEGSGKLVKYRHLLKGPNQNICLKSYANDFGRLAQGVGTRIPTDTNTIFFVPFNKVSKERNISDIKPVATI